MTTHCGPITFAARVFLSRNHIYPGYVSRELEKASLRGRRYDDDRRRLQLQGTSRNRWYMIPHGNADNHATLEYDPRSGNTLLKVARRRHLYREQSNGLAQLFLFGVTLPDVVCAAAPKGSHRLLDIVEHDYDPYYRSSNPIVISLRNDVRGGRRGLLLTVRPVWNAAHGSYSDGRHEWRE